MFNQFRLHYPQGSLVTELSAIDHGKYIVRCLVQVEGTTLVTALAAASTVELAEDQARSRALAVLGIPSTTATEEQETPIANQKVRVVPQPPLPTPIVPPSFPSENLYETQVTRFPEPSMVEDTHSFSALHSKSEEMAERAVTTSLVADQITLPDDAFTADSASQEIESSHWVTDQKSSSTQLKEPTVKSSARSKVKLEEETSQVTPPETPVDFSDIIARTNVELKRLGWTTQQGKDYLLQTYGKRSRQLLSDAELLDFLHHLEAQPTPDD